MAIAYYYFPRSHWSRVVSLVLYEKGLWHGLERHLVDIRKGETYDPEYMVLNPRGVVPTLVLDGEVWWDSPQIVGRLDAAVGPIVMPKTPEDIQLVESLENLRLMHLSYEIWTLGLNGERSAEILDDKVSRAERYVQRYPEHASLYERKRDFFGKFRDEVYDAEFMAAVHDETRSTLDKLAGVVSEREWAGGDSWGFADALATSILFRLIDLGSIDAWNVPDHTLSLYYQRLTSRPGFTAVWLQDPLLAELDS